VQDALLKEYLLQLSTLIIHNKRTLADNYKYNSLVSRLEDMSMLTTLRNLKESVVVNREVCGFQTKFFEAS